MTEFVYKPSFRAIFCLPQAAQLAAAEEVKVEVGHLLTGLNAGVYHQSIAFFGHTLLLRQLDGGEAHVGEETPVLGGGFGKRRDVGFGHNQKVGGRLRVDIADGNNLLILIQDIAFELAAYNAAKDTLHFRDLLR